MKEQHGRTLYELLTVNGGSLVSGVLFQQGTKTAFEVARQRISGHDFAYDSLLFNNEKSLRNLSYATLVDDHLKVKKKELEKRVNEFSDSCAHKLGAGKI